jgi:hypothetical protein
MKINKAGFIPVIILLIILLIYPAGCTGKDDDYLTTDKDPGTEDTEETIPETTVEIEASTGEEIDLPSTESTSEQQEETDENENQADENIIIFEGNRVDENRAIMVIEINRETGDVSGVLQMGFTSFDMEINSTKVCDYVLTGSISGRLDFETLQIGGNLKGKAVTDTVSGDCNDYNVDYEMVANMTDDFSKIRGYFDTVTLGKYEFFLKNVTEEL